MNQIMMISTVAAMVVIEGLKTDFARVVRNCSRRVAVIVVVVVKKSIVEVKVVAINHRCFR